jgi:hypothetical protein
MKGMHRGYTKWYALFPLDAYSISFDFSLPLTERQFRAYLRKWEGVNRLTGVQIWHEGRRMTMLSKQWEHIARHYYECIL